jgi:hypothetical protein
MQYFEILWVWLVLHSFNFFWIHPDAILSNQMAQVFYF